MEEHEADHGVGTQDRCLPLNREVGVKQLMISIFVSFFRTFTKAEELFNCRRLDCSLFSGLG